MLLIMNTLILSESQIIFTCIILLDSQISLWEMLTPLRKIDAGLAVTLFTRDEKKKKGNNLKARETIVKYVMGPLCNGEFDSY